jgi:hypothetical protein
MSEQYKYQKYEAYKLKLQAQNLPPAEYERLIRAYCKRNRI